VCLSSPAVRLEGRAPTIEFFLVGRISQGKTHPRNPGGTFLSRIDELLNWPERDIQQARRDEWGSALAAPIDLNWLLSASICRAKNPQHRHWFVVRPHCSEHWRYGAGLEKTVYRRPPGKGIWFLIVFVPPTGGRSAGRTCRQRPASAP